MSIDREIFEDRLNLVSMCGLQYRGYPCGSCFFEMDDSLTNEDWQSLLLYRGDYKKEDLNNLPADPMKSIKKIWDIIKKR